MPDPRAGLLIGSDMMRFVRYFSKPALSTAIRPVDVALLYGTHTGNSKQNALRLESELQWRLNLKTISGACDEFEFNDLHLIDKNKLLLFFITSYGQGGPTKDADGFWNTLMQSNACLDNIQYSVFGRGSSAYATYNDAGVATDTQLALRGARRFSPYGQQDRLAIDLEEPYYNWKESVVQELIRKYNLKEQPLVYIPKHTIQKSPESAEWSPTPQELLTSLAIITPERPAPEYATVSKKVTKDETGREFVHATFDLSRTSQLYEAGDYIVVWPSNDEHETETFLKAFNLKGDQIVTVDSKWISTYRYLARHYIDINGKPNRGTLKYFIKYAPNDHARKNLEQVCSAHDTFEVFVRDHFNIARMLLACSDGQPWKVPDTMILDILPSLQPRDYSISSSPLKDSQSATIGIVVEGTGGWNGVATNFLKNIPDNTPVPVCTDVSEFKLPSDPSIPIIMIGIGTGTSPYRGFVEERKELKAAGASVGDALLFAGFRSPESFQYADFFHNTPQLEVHTAFSRTGATQYVQAVLREHGEKVYDLINQGAYIYVCGSARLLKRHIRDAIIDVIAENEGISVAAAALQFKILKRHGRIRQDAW